MEQRPKKLLDRVRETIRRKHYSIRTEKSCVAWIRRYILFHNRCRSQEMGWAKLRLLHLIFILYNKTSSNTTWGGKYDEHDLVQF